MTIFRKPTVLCDRCGTYEPAVELPEGGEAVLPDGWKSVRGKDLCTICAEEWDKFWNQFIDSYRSQED